MLEHIGQEFPSRLRTLLAEILYSEQPVELIDTTMPTAVLHRAGSNFYLVELDRSVSLYEITPNYARRPLIILPTGLAPHDTAFHAKQRVEARRQWRTGHQANAIELIRSQLRAATAPFKASLSTGTVDEFYEFISALADLCNIPIQVTFGSEPQHSRFRALSKRKDPQASTLSDALHVAFEHLQIHGDMANTSRLPELSRMPVEIHSSPKMSGEFSAHDILSIVSRMERLLESSGDGIPRRYIDAMISAQVSVS